MITKEQYDLLIKAKEDQLPLGKAFYNSNPVLQDLVKLGYLSWERGVEDSEYSYMDYGTTIQEEITGYHLTLKGEEAVSSFKAQQQQNRIMGLKYPIFVRAIWWAIGFITSYVVQFVIHLFK